MAEAEEWTKEGMEGRRPSCFDFFLDECENGARVRVHASRAVRSRAGGAAAGPMAQWYAAAESLLHCERWGACGWVRGQQFRAAATGRASGVVRTLNPES